MPIYIQLPIGQSHNTVAVAVPVVVTLIAVAFISLLGVLLCVRYRRNLWVKQSLSKSTEVDANIYRHHEFYDDRSQRCKIIKFVNL